MKDNENRPNDCPLKMASTLHRAADLLEPEGAWMQGDWAVTKTGYQTSDKTQAACWCAVGAINHVLDNNYQDYDDIPEITYLENMLGQNVMSWNDTDGRRQEQVTAKFREAARKLIKEGTNVAIQEETPAS